MSGNIDKSGNACTLNHYYDHGDQIGNYQLFPFKTVMNLSPGINLISVFSRDRHGFTYERKLRILRGL